MRAQRIASRIWSTSCVVNDSGRVLSRRTEICMVAVPVGFP
jgi:hypothetical protein